MKRHPVLADIILMKSDADISFCYGIAGSRSVDCPKCGGKAYGLYYDFEIRSYFLEEPLCETCGWMDNRIKVPYPRNGDPEYRSLDDAWLS
jgi:hypothetical protein